MKDYYVYILIDPRSNLPFYVGKGKRKRYLEHLKEYEKQYEYYSKLYKTPAMMLSLKLKTIHELKLANKQYEYDLIENLSEEDAFLLEQSLICWFGRQLCGNGILTNIQCGGKYGDLYFDDVSLISLIERNDLQQEILKYPRTCTEWIAKELYFFTDEEDGYPFEILKIDWLFRYNRCFEQYAVLVIENLKKYDAVITPYYWVRKDKQKDNNNYHLENILIFDDSLNFIKEAYGQEKNLDNYNKYKEHLNSLLIK